MVLISSLRSGGVINNRVLDEMLAVSKNVSLFSVYVSSEPVSALPWLVSCKQLKYINSNYRCHLLLVRCSSKYDKNHPN